MLIKPMPSPSGTNFERIYILQGSRRRSSPKGAYDSARRAYDGGDPVSQLVSWIEENLDDDARSRLIETLANRPARPAEDEDSPPSVDPTQTRRRAPGARVGMDAASTKGLFERFPDLARIGIA
jgi:hypothetical protein